MLVNSLGDFIDVLFLILLITGLAGDVCLMFFLGLWCWFWRSLLVEFVALDIRLAQEFYQNFHEKFASELPSWRQAGPGDGFLLGFAWFYIGFLGISMVLLWVFLRIWHCFTFFFCGGARGYIRFFTVLHGFLGYFYMYFNPPQIGAIFPLEWTS